MLRVGLAFCLLGVWVECQGVLLRVQCLGDSLGLSGGVLCVRVRYESHRITKTMEIQVKAVHAVDPDNKVVVWKSKSLTRSVNPWLRIDTYVD